jgi:hypothetical protein
MSGPCAKLRVVTTIVTPDGRRFVGANDCEAPQANCPRVGLPTGVGYHLCCEVCRQNAHAEVVAIAAAGEAAQGAKIYVEGCSYACADCLVVCDAAGIEDVIIGAPPPLRPARPRLIGFCGLGRREKASQPLTSSASMASAASASPDC